MTHVRRSGLGLWRDRAGVGAIEFAFVAGILSVLLLGIVDFGIGFWEKMQVANAARAGAEYAVRHGYDSTNIQNAATNATNLSGITATLPNGEFCGCPNVSTGITQATCNSSCPNSGGTAGSYVTVNAQVSYRTIFAWPGIPRPVTLSSSATVKIN